MEAVLGAAECARVIEYRRDLLEKCPRKPSMCAHLPSSRYGDRA